MVALAWPMVGRRRELERIGGALRAGSSGVVLVGPAGVGKSRLGADALGVAAGLGFATARVRATRSAAALPLGAFAMLLAPAVPPGLGRSELLSWALRAVVAGSNGRRLALLVDDAHALDDLSAALTRELIVTRSAFVIATVRSGEPLPEAIESLTRTGSAERFDVGAFSRDVVEELLPLVLGGPVDGETVHRVSDSSAGNALYLRELVLGGIDTGALFDDGGIWRWAGELSLSSRLVEVVVARLGRLTDSERTALGLVAWGEPVGVSLLEALCGGTAVESLEVRGLVAIADDGRRREARLAHPLHGEVVRGQAASSEVRRANRDLADALERSGLKRRDDVLRFARWRLDGGGTVDTGLMLRAASEARARWDLQLAERLARAAADGGGCFDAALLIGQLHWLQGRAEEAEQQFAELWLRAETDDQRIRVVVSRIENLVLNQTRLSDAVDVAATAEASIRDQTARDQITAERARMLHEGGQTGAAIDVALPLLATAQGRTLVAACLTAASSLSRAGRIAEAVEVTHRGYAAHLALTGPQPPVEPYQHLVNRTAALFHAGLLDEAEALAMVEYRRAVEERSHRAQGAFALLLAVVAVTRGQVQTAARFAREAVAVFRERGLLALRRLATARLAQSLALAGAANEAAAVLAELDALALPPLHLRDAHERGARAWTAVARADMAEARRLLQEAADLAHRNGDAMVESVYLHDLARIGHADQVLARLTALAATVEGPMAQARAAHGAGLAHRDPQQLLGAADAFEAVGSWLLVAEAAATASVVLRRNGYRSGAERASERATAFAARCEGATTPALLALSGQALLTGRELEVAYLAARGLSNKAIAAQLSVVPRTVESLLQRVYDKLGVHRRRDLAAALGPVRRAPATQA